MIMAGGSGTRLWPMSRARQPKQLIPFINGKNLLQLAMDRLEGVVPVDDIYICAGQAHREAILSTVNGSAADRFYGEPVGRDTLNAVGLVAAERVQKDPEAIIAVFTADHVIEPVDQFQKIVEQGYQIAESSPNALVTFGITPTHAATAYGYLELADPLSPVPESAPNDRRQSACGTGHVAARVVKQFREKPEAATAAAYVSAGPDKYLWNSGMFVWPAATLMECIKRYAPENHRSLAQLGEIWDTDAAADTLAKVYPQLARISVDYAVMEPASKDPDFQVVAVPMPLTWLDVGSWPAFAPLCPTDENQNHLAARKRLLLDSTNTLVVSSDDGHLITTIGCEDMIIVHTPDATLVCHRNCAEQIKKLHEMVADQFGRSMV